jgi:hypothetical protein
MENPQHALDYRSHYGNPYHNPYGQNPLSVGQWAMIGAGALAVGGLGYWIYAKMKTNGNGAAANGANANGNGNGTEGNPYNWHRAA